MTAPDPPDCLSGDLRICPSRGTVMNAGGDAARLGPVNMKVLMALISRAGGMVSRTEIYDTVWRNQVVGEDALTRCISDIRGELRKLSGSDDWIETVPKRGYRWVKPATGLSADEAARSEAPVSTDLAAAADPSAAADPAASAGIRIDPGAPGASGSAISFDRRLLALLSRGALYLAALVLMGSIFVWVLDRLTGASEPVVAALPVTAAAPYVEYAAQLDVEISAYLTGLGLVRVLSPSAIGARPSNPFPFFFYEFGARWLIEGELRAMSGNPLLTLTVADARTGIVEFQASELLGDETLPAGIGHRKALADLGRFLGEELGP